MKIISFSGKKGSGKDTAADIVERILGKENVNRCAFADKLKKVCMEVFKLDYDQVYGDRKEEAFVKDSVWFLSGEQIAVLEAYCLDRHLRSADFIVEFYNPRQILQYVGSNFLRSFDKKIHLRHIPLAEDKINIVTDARFSNELEFLAKKALCFSPGPAFNNHLPLYIARETESTDSHESESDQTLGHIFIRIVHNHGSINELENKLRGIVIKDWWIK